MKKVRIFFYFIFLFINCKNQTKTNHLVLKIDIVIKQTDSVNAYYTSSKSIDFSDKQSFWTKVIGSNKNQIISIVFPDSIRPKQVRLDFGKNKKQQEIILNKFTFKYKKNDISFKGKEIFYVFREDQNNTTLDKSNGSVNRKFLNQISGPSLYPKGNKLYDCLNQLYTKE